jgi:Holliday junction resolvase RusA-like endonuclease
MTRWLRVRGIPQAQGSVRAFVAGGRAHVATEGNRTNSPLGAWRTAIATEARREYGSEPAPRGPVKLFAWLTWPRPLAHYRAGKPERGLRADAPLAKPSRPDVDKAARAILDALAGIAYVDDAQVVELTVRKLWGDSPGAVIAISDAGEPDWSTP